MSSTMLQTASAYDVLVNLTGQKEGWIHTPVSEDDVMMFPIGQIFKFLDLSGTETVNHYSDPWHSYVTFQGRCFKITERTTTVQEYEVDESGACINATGNTYQLEKPAIYIDDPNIGVFVPLSFISKVLADAPYGNTFSTSYVDDNLEFSMYTLDGSGSKQLINPITLAMKVNSPWLLTVDDGNLFDDADHNVTPVTRQGATLLPIAPIISNLGGKTTWNSSERKVTISLNENTVELWIDNSVALVNGQNKKLTVAPTAINGRTMVPLRFVTESLGADVKWYKDSQLIVVYYGGAIENSTDLFTFEYKISLLDAVQKQEDNRVTLEDVVKEHQEKHSQVKYNDTDPLDYYGNMIYVGDTVGVGTINGIVKKVSGTKVLVYWNSANYLLIDRGSEEESAALFGIPWLSEQWVEAKSVVVSGYGY